MPNFNSDKLKSNNSAKDLKKLQDALLELENALNVLSVYVKYQAFDLEATKRENRFLKCMLKEYEGEDDDEREM